MPSLVERLEGALVGLLVGDALGVPYEFHPPAALPPEHHIDFEPPPGFRPAHRVPPGTWSDDGAQALCLLDSLLSRGRFDAADFGRRLLRWWEEGYLAVDGDVFDIGITTQRGLLALKSGAPADAAGPAGERDNGNGSLMRVLPLALWHAGTDAELAADARATSRVTHGHIRAQACCAVYCLWARRLIEGHDAEADWTRAASALRDLARDDAALAAELPNLRLDASAGGAGTGYVLDCLHSARWAVARGPYEQAVRAAVALGHDTDTTACIAGLRDGVQAIPARWRDALRGRDLLEPLLHGLRRRV
jgi:ADP-ribosyl-[dinitrogen reductase] hydrolase